MNNDLAIAICEMLKTEADGIIKYLKSGGEAMRSGSPESVETVKMFNDLVIDGVEHSQRLVMKLSECFFTGKEGTDNE